MGVARVLLVLISTFVAVPALSRPSPAADTNGEALQLRLFHRSELKFLQDAEDDPAGDAFRRFVEIARRDQLRQKHIARTLLSPRRRASEVSFEAPISSGAYAGVGQYFVKLNVGSPAKEHLLVADTGSDATWIKCQTGCAPSSSFVPYRCSSDSCKSLPFSLTTCPSPASPCLYDYQYADGSFTKGTYGNETVTFTSPDGTVSTIRDVLVGRSSEFEGTSFNKADGVLALGFSAMSFAIAAAQIYGAKFSYCLVDHLSMKDSNYLVVGDNPRVSNRSNLQFTPLVFDPRIQPFYGLQVDGISLDGKILPIYPSVWKFVFSNYSITGGAIIDSGMTLTSLVRPAYDVVLANFQSYFQDFPTFTQPPFDLCFNESQLSEEQRKKAGPQLGWHFAGGAKFMPHMDSYVSPVAPDQKCLTIVRAAWPGISVIGNIHQQKYLWEFNLENANLGFAPSLCSD
ncbi:aspartic proteinase NANA, chloroplast-like [Nymphaea colorata]|nr:aspartic proteinase NANA, chloroplast-like [Nymphaea colorata]